MTLAEILTNYTYTFLLVFIRYLGLFLMAPIFASRVIPVRVKLGLAFLVAVITMSLVTEMAVTFPENEIKILIDGVREVSIGFALGYIAYLAFAAIQLAGRFIDLRLGFAMVNVADPIHGETVPLTGQFKNILAILLFLGINGHHQLIYALNYSFQIIPLGGAVLKNVTMEFIFRMTGNLFLLAFQLALPVVATLFIADVILGFLARTIPQMNIFVVGFPLKILIGFVVLLFSLHFVIYYFSTLFQDMFKQLYQLIQLMV